VRLDGDQARALFASRRVARLATMTAARTPHLVPIVFALAVDGAVAGGTIYSAVDAKPKSTLALQRLANIAANPSVCLLADHYDEDWTQLWWARADGVARLAQGAEAAAAVELLSARYPQYIAEPPPGPVIAVDITSWTGWSG
jgi:PPOX class probable F420-dependent enzyme